MKPNADIHKFAEDIIDMAVKLHGYFNGDAAKIKRWIGTPNPMLGEMAPIMFAARGRAHKVLQFIDTSLEENKD